jgi:hypothetical protein
MIGAWFICLFTWNLVSDWTRYENFNMLARILAAVGDITSPVEFFLSAIVLVILWKRKPLAER